MLRKAYTFEKLIPFSVDDQQDVHLVEVFPKTSKPSKKKPKYQEIIDLTGDVPHSIFCLASTTDEDDEKRDWKVKNETCVTSKGKKKAEVTSPSISTSSLSTSSPSTSSLSSARGKALQSKLRLRKRGICRAGIKAPPPRRKGAPPNTLVLHDANAWSEEAELELGASFSPKRCRLRTRKGEEEARLKEQNVGKGKGKDPGKGKKSQPEPEY